MKRNFTLLHRKHLGIAMRKVRLGKRWDEETKIKIGLANSKIGKRAITKNGYIRITLSTYPNYNRVYEHRFIMEKYLGRKLQYDENIHHLNHNKTDNRIENMIIIKRDKHNKIHAVERIKKGKHNGRFIK